MKRRLPTATLTGAALDWAVARAHGLQPTIGTYGPLFGRSERRPMSRRGPYAPSTNWHQGGPIIERELIETAPTYADDGKTATGWTAMMFNDERCKDQLIVEHGPTPLVAAMRCYVASHLGAEVDVPEELCA